MDFKSYQINSYDDYKDFMIHYHEFLKEINNEEDQKYLDEKSRFYFDRYKEEIELDYQNSKRTLRRKSSLFNFKLPGLLRKSSSKENVLSNSDH